MATQHGGCHACLLIGLSPLIHNVLLPKDTAYSFAFFPPKSDIRHPVQLSTLLLSPSPEPQPCPTLSSWTDRTRMHGVPAVAEDLSIDRPERVPPPDGGSAAAEVRDGVQASGSWELGAGSIMFPACFLHSALAQDSTHGTHVTQCGLRLLLLVPANLWGT